MPSYRLPPGQGLLALVFLALVIYALVAVPASVMAASFERLGLTPLQGFAVLLAMLLTKDLSVPLFRSKRLVPDQDPGGFQARFGPLGAFIQMSQRLQQEGEGASELVPQEYAVSVGGFVVPLALSAYLVARAPDAQALLPWLGMSVALAAGICAAFTRPSPFTGLSLPVLAPPLGAALCAMLVVPAAYGPETAWISGSLGGLLGAAAHLLIPAMRARIQTPRVVLGGAGSFGGIFLVAFLAGLLAGMPPGMGL